MRHNLEEQLNTIRPKALSGDDKNALWSSIAIQSLKETREEAILSFNYKKYMIGAVLSLMIILGAGGAVAASNNAVPGDALFGVDLAVERAKLRLATSDEKKDEIRERIAKERVEEARVIADMRGSANVRDTDLSGATITEIEVDIFTNETTVKIEADGKHYGFVTDADNRSDIIAEIVAKYDLERARVESLINIETEDRASRPDDKGFLNSSNSLEASFKKDDKQKRDIERGLQRMEDARTSGEVSAATSVKLEAAIEEIKSLWEANGGGKVKFEDDDMKIEIKKDGEVKIDVKNDNKNGNGNSRSDDNPSSDRGNDVRESDDEVYCDGEWRDVEDCEKRGATIEIGAGVNASLGGGSQGGDVRESEDEVFCRGEWRDPEDC